MPRYFFHTEDGQCIRDDEGEILADDHAARGVALAVLGEILRYRGDEFWKTGRFAVIATGEGGRVVTVLTASADEREAA